MTNWYSAGHIAKDHIHTDITCNIKERHKEYRLETANYRLLGGGGGALPKPNLIVTWAVGD